MSEIIGNKVPFTPTNVGKCQCPKCPVQSKSQCVSGKLATIKEALSKSPLKREDIPGQYCARQRARSSILNKLVSVATVLSLRNTTSQREHPLATIAEMGSQSDKVGLSISEKDERLGHGTPRA